MNSVAVHGILILSPCLLVVAGLAECLPVVAVPHQGAVASVGLYVIDYRCLGVSSFGQALHTQRVALKILFACFAPSAPVPSACGRRSVRLLMLLAESFCCQVRAAGVTAGV